MLDRPALWQSGGATTVANEIGQPFDICGESRGVVSYVVPYRVSSDDGRVAVTGDARAYARYDGATLGNAWIEIYDPDPVRKEGLAAASGIEGIDFGEVSGALWHTELYFDDRTDDGVHNPALRGEVTVEGVDIDGNITGIENAFTDVLDSLTW
jgi:hypothetical protein